MSASFFFFNGPATTEIYTLSLHDALPISGKTTLHCTLLHCTALGRKRKRGLIMRSEEHTSELQSRLHLVCRLLLEKKKTQFFAQHNDNFEVFFIQFQIRTEKAITLPAYSP